MSMATQKKRRPLISVLSSAKNRKLGRRTTVRLRLSTSLSFSSLDVSVSNDARIFLGIAVAPKKIERSVNLSELWTN